VSDTDTSTETTAPAEQTQAENATKTGEQTDADNERGEQPDGVDSLPKWARDRLTKANNEAARYRTGLRDAEVKLAGAKTPEQFVAAVAELREGNARLERELLVERVARKAELPEELAALLQGDTEDALKAHAAKLRKFVTPAQEAPQSLRGGLDPTDENDFDPVQAAHAARRHRY
jgi:hypothetical protein